jgi:hypothetical protein
MFLLWINDIQNYFIKLGPAVMAAPYLPHIFTRLSSIIVSNTFPLLLLFNNIGLGL